MTQLAGDNKASLVIDNRSAPVARLVDHMALTKPRISLMVVVTAGIGMAMVPQWTWVTLLGTLFGTALASMGANTLNQVLEQDTDAKMQRTMSRPLPAGRMSTIEALVAGICCSIAGIAILWTLTGALAAALAAATIGAYCLVYTPMKRLSPSALLIGAVPGAMGPVIGYAAAAGRIDVAAWLLFAIMFVWQVPHFLAIAWLYRDQYAAAGLPVLAVLDPTGVRSGRQILIGCLTLLPLGGLPTMLGVSGSIYFFTALACGMMFLAFGIALVIQPSRPRARRLFLASLVYLPVVLTVMMTNKI